MAHIIHYMIKNIFNKEFFQKYQHLRIKCLDTIHANLKIKFKNRKQQELLYQNNLILLIDIHCKLHDMDILIFNTIITK